MKEFPPEKGIDVRFFSFLKKKKELEKGLELINEQKGHVLVYGKNEPDKENVISSIIQSWDGSILAFDVDGNLFSGLLEEQKTKTKFADVNDEVKMKELEEKEHIFYKISSAEYKKSMSKVSFKINDYIQSFHQRNSSEEYLTQQNILCILNNCSKVGKIILLIDALATMKGRSVYFLIIEDEPSCIQKIYGELYGVMEGCSKYKICTSLVDNIKYVNPDEVQKVDYDNYILFIYLDERTCPETLKYERIKKQF